MTLMRLLEPSLDLLCHASNALRIEVRPLSLSVNRKDKTSDILTSGNGMIGQKTDGPTKIVTAGNRRRKEIKTRKQALARARNPVRAVAKLGTYAVTVVCSDSAVHSSFRMATSAAGTIFKASVGCKIQLGAKTLKHVLS